MLTWEAVLQIRARRKQGATLKQLAAEFHIDRSQAWNIVTDRSWKTPQPFKTWRDEKQRYEIDMDSGCWNWLGFLNKDGYGIKALGDGPDGKRRLIGAHRWAYEQKRGPIPADKEIDHLCRNRRCVNPDHLEPVPHRTNVRRGDRTRLQPEDWKTIRTLYEHTVMTQALLAKVFGVQQAVISKIVLEKPGYQSKSDK